MSCKCSLVTMLNYRHILLSLICLTEASLLARFRDFYFESVEFINETSKVPFDGKASLKRSGRDHPKIFIEFELTDTLRDYDGEVKISYSPLGNKQFMLTPYKFGRQSVCKMLGVQFLKDTIHGMQNCSNLPPPESNVALCDMPLGTYFIRNCSIDASIVPSVALPGRYRVVMLYYKRGENEVAQAWEFRSVFT